MGHSEGRKGGLWRANSKTELLYVVRDYSWRVPSVFSPEYVCHEKDQTSREACNDKLVDGEDLLQSVDPLLHGARVEVVIDAGCDAPHRPHSVHHERHCEVSQGGSAAGGQEVGSASGQHQEEDTDQQLGSTRSAALHAGNTHTDCHCVT